MRWPFSRASREEASAQPTARFSNPPRLWAPGWEVEMFAKSGEPRWCAATTVYEVPPLGPGRRQFWERRLSVLAGSEVYLDQQPGRPIREAEQLLAAIGEGRLVYFPPSGGEVYRLGVVYTVTFKDSWLSADDLALDVADVQGQLNGESPRLSQCRAALANWAANPDAEATNALRERYYATSRLARRFLMGMDAKDNGVRLFFEAKDEKERERQREALLATCRLYADEIGFTPSASSTR